MNPLSLVAEHCAKSGHTSAFQNAKILGRNNNRVARETIEAWHMETTSINCCVALSAAYQALRTQLNERRSKVEVWPVLKPNAGELTTDLHVATLQIGPDDGAVISTAASTTTLADGEKRGQRDLIKESKSGRQVRLTRMRAMVTIVLIPPPPPMRGKQIDKSHPPFHTAPATAETIPVRMRATSAEAD
nr:unnamed protein product [Spirometra erinaceieuropaei]